MNVKRSLFGLMMCLALCGCGYMPISTIWALRNFDALKMDASQLRAAVRIPDTIGIRPGGVKIDIASWQDGDETHKHQAKFVLQETTDAGESAPLHHEQQPGSQLIVFKVNPDDLARITALQAKIRAENAANPAKRQGNFSISADACRKPELGDGPVVMTTYLRLENGQDYLPLLKNLDIRAEVKNETDFERLLPPCAKAAGKAAIVNVATPE